eukprot:TRINITY_DN13866_c0_g1_i5.p1 TRINITY_DN13866_c0_g1~~TRINITY_DN13866_c0_g1_i5.p1  ORF type:complete len:379 (+),score=138.52 TRINITY_DN13866_c0_g1_i5:243-1379(+)
MADKAGGDKNEVALSVEETNKLRAELGLKALDEGKKDVAKENWIAEEEERLKKKQSEDLAKKLEKAKSKRELNKKSTRKGIADELRDAGEDLSAADWVKLNRKRVAKHQREAELKAKMLDAQDEADEYDATDLAGLTVGHTADELKDGQTVILTLKDQSILEGTGEYISRIDGGDELENVGLVDNQVAKRNNKRKNYSSGDRGYNPFDDHEFNEDGSINTKKRSILEKYDDEHEFNRKSLVDDKKKIVITGEGLGKVAESVVPEKFEGEQDPIALQLKQKIAESLAVKFDKVKEQYTTEEAASFKRTDGKKMRKKKKIRAKKESIEWDAVPEAVSYTHLRAHETPEHLVCRLLLEKKKKKKKKYRHIVTHEYEKRVEQ